MEKEGEGAHCLPYKHLLSCPFGVSPSQVSVVFHESFDRMSHSDHSLESSISEIWDQRIQQNTSLYNGKKFRYGGSVLDDGGGSSQEPHVCLHLGLTDYRSLPLPSSDACMCIFTWTFVGTNLNPSWQKFLVESEDDTIRCQHTSSPLGNGAVVETSDKKILVLQRSNNVGEFPGHFVFPGGHPEPEEVEIVSHQHDKNLTDFELINQKVSQEMFDSIIREVVEEIGVPAISLSTPVFIGISRRELNVRPTAFFFIKCRLQSKEIQQHYCRAQDGYESTELFTVSASDLENMTPKMPGCHHGGFALYKLMIEVAKDV
ncbi:nudix hydrolase 9 isoform X1 [Malania oleifera]|uniref:nudix hydrolase 9 isoform X1 n=1 Tax=Malania oleifera TaxID=397392 RepID=UPI0025ADD0FA|nr:nudix hydrolase 9 isoform X1 [Malania oleifera]XP_057954164.1 nudix hydrolase 9 isoform X1 [Malania oleifera]XP_057954165.1 nudix hydrolase 9 isoform X1 [Malania oleifera]